jgi:hypothetical protein
LDNVGVVFFGFLYNINAVFAEIESLDGFEEWVVMLDGEDGVTDTTAHFANDEEFGGVLLVGLFKLLKLVDFSFEVVAVFEEVGLMELVELIPNFMGICVVFVVEFF